MKNYDFIMTMSLVVISKLRQLVVGCITVASTQTNVINW